MSFNLSQLGMIRHWTRHLQTERDPAVRRRMMRSRAINTFGLGMTAVVLVIVLITKFLAGAWITILAMAFFFMVMQAIGRHYARVELELAADEQDKVMPTRVHAIVLASKLHKPTLRALAFARATRPNVLEAIYVGIDTKATNRLLEEWDERHLDIPLKVLHSPYREVVRPIVEYTQEIRRASPRGVVAVYIPEYVVGRWWEQLLHNQTALRLKGRLLFTPGRHGHLGALPAALVAGRPGAGEARRGARARRRPPPRSRDAPLAPGGRPVSRHHHRPRKARGRSRVGERFEAEVGPVAHGGHCVARLPEPESRVVFVRHALPGERVVVEITEGTDGDRFWRGDAVSVLRRLARPRRGAVPLRRPRACAAAATSSTSPCRRSATSRPRWCASSWSASAGSTPTSAAGHRRGGRGGAGPGRPDDGLRWRTRQRYAALPDGQPGDAGPPLPPSSCRSTTA